MSHEWEIGIIVIVIIFIILVYYFYKRKMYDSSGGLDSVIKKMEYKMVDNMASNLG